MSQRITGDDLLSLGLKGKAIGVALRLIPKASKSLDHDAILRELQAVVSDPVSNAAHPQFSEVATLLREELDKPTFVERAQPAPYKVWGEGLDENATEQMRQAVRLPVAVAGALMPDAHLGYGLPIGGVLATENAVIPYAVGVDIACRMRLTVFDIPAKDLKRLNDQLAKTLERETKFGTGGEFQKPLDHEVLEEDWNITAITKKNFAKARGQLGTSGSGNHFVEFGIFTLEKPDMGLEPGEYLSLLSHSGSRGTGAAVADFYSRLAAAKHPELPDELRRLAWLSLDEEAGQEYWAAMNLMGKYAAANHAMIHKKITRALGAKVIAGIENHHNFAWKETHNGREVIVHRKGATPAGRGVMGVIPGSMATPGFIVRGKGLAESLESASHGAGRAMSRTAAREKFRWAHVKPMLEAAGVQLLSAGIDEAPVAYKNIHDVMSAQSDLVEVVARFDPKIVKMADAGEKPED
jgi:tRNA-splicing ligase RtcB